MFVLSFFIFLLFPLKEPHFKMSLCFFPIHHLLLHDSGSYPSKLEAHPQPLKPHPPPYHTCFVGIFGTKIFALCHRSLDFAIFSKNSVIVFSLLDRHLDLFRDRSLQSKLFCYRGHWQVVPKAKNLSSNLRTEEKQSRGHKKWGATSFYFKKVFFANSLVSLCGGIHQVLLSQFSLWV